MLDGAERAAVPEVGREALVLGSEVLLRRVFSEIRDELDNARVTRGLVLRDRPTDASPPAADAALGQAVR